MKALHFIFSGPASRFKQLAAISDHGISITMKERAECIARNLLADLGPGRLLRILSAPDHSSREMAGSLVDFLPQTLKTVPAFKSMDLGEWSELSPETILIQDASRFRSWKQDPNFPSPGGEAIADFARRLWTELVFEVEQSSEEEDLVFYVSDLMIAIVVCQILEAPLTSAHLLVMNPASRTTFRKVEEGFFQLELFNRPWNADLEFTDPEVDVPSLDPKEEPLSVPV